MGGANKETKFEGQSSCPLTNRTSNGWGSNDKLSCSFFEKGS